MQTKKSIRLKNFNYQSKHVYHVIICTHNKKKIFTNNILNKQIVECLFKARDEFNFCIYAYCIMPNHIHLLCSPLSKTSIPEFIKYFKGRITPMFRKFSQEKLWQRSYFDRIIRKAEDINILSAYILNNPVRKGLTDNYENYQFGGYVDSIPW